MQLYAVWSRREVEAPRCLPLLSSKKKFWYQAFLAEVSWQGLQNVHDAKQTPDVEGEQRTAVQEAPTSKGERKQETLLAPQDPTGDVTNCRVTSVSLFQHRVIPLFPPLPFTTLRYVSKSFLAAFLTSSLPFINTISAKFTISVANSVLICPFILCFIPFLNPTLCLWPVLSILCFFTVIPLSAEYRGIYLLETWMQMNAELGLFLLKELACFPDSSM